MKKNLICLCTIFIILFLSNYESYSSTMSTLPNKERKEIMKTINIQIGSKNFAAKLYDNAATQALILQMPMTLNMSDLNRNEKCYYLSEKLPIDSQSIGKIQAGDLMLFGSDCLVLFYESFQTSYSYTKLGYIENITGLTSALGKGNVEVKFTLSSE